MEERKVIKNEIILFKEFIINSTINESVCKLAVLENYLNGIKNVLGQKNKIKLNKFFLKLIDYYTSSELPKLLSVHHTLKLYKMYINTPLLMDFLIDELEKNSSKTLKSLEFQLIVIEASDYHSSNFDLFKFNFNKTKKIIKELKISVENFNFYQKLIELILNDKKTIHQKVDLKNRKKLNTFVLHYLKCFQKKQLPIEIYIDFYKKFNKSNPTLTIDFLVLLDERFPEFYFNKITNRDLSKLYYLYTLNNCIIEKIPKTDTLELTKILQPIFHSYSVSNLLLDYFLKDFYLVNKHSKSWFEHLVRGQNLIKAKNLPFQITKKEAHIFNNYIFDFNVKIENAMVISALINNGVGYEYAEYATSRIIVKNDLRYWIELVSNLHFYKVSQDKLIEVLDYVFYLKEKFNRKINLKRKKLVNLFNEIESWHEDLRRRKKIRDAYYEFPLTKLDNYSTEYKGNKYIICQLLNTKELYNEASFLKHCVLSYNLDCKNGEKSIFSLREELDGKYIPKITIELIDNIVTQKLGSYNRVCSSTENNIIKKWARINNISIDKYTV